MAIERRGTGTRQLYGAVALLVLACSCTPPPPSRVGVSSEVPEAEPEPKHPEVEPAPKPVPPDIVERSALPFSTLRVAGHVPLSSTEFFDELASQDVVCVAEHHDNPHHHWAELYIVQEMAKRGETSGRELGLGLEMFQRPFQEELDRYRANKIGVSELLEQTDYEERWGFPFAYYAPQIDHAVARGAELVALNAAREQTRRVAKGGLAALTPREARLLGDVDLDNEAHKEQFDRLMQDHPQGMGSSEHLYEAQVLWDETMAATASAWLAARSPARQLVILAGAAHCHESAIPARIKQRMRAKVVSVLPAMKVADDAKLELDGYDYAFVMGSE